MQGITDLIFYAFEQATKDLPRERVHVEYFTAKVPAVTEGGFTERPYSDADGADGEHEDDDLLFWIEK